LVLDNDQNAWIAVSKKNKKSKKAKHKAKADVSNNRLMYQDKNGDQDIARGYPPHVKGNKPLNRKDRRRHKQQKKVYDTIHIVDVPVFS
jgi:hypothetical protein